MQFDFHPLFRITFAELSRKYPYSQTPAISRVCIEGNANTRGLGVWLSQSLTSGNLATACGICFRKLKKHHEAVTTAGARMCFWTMAFGCREASPLEARLLLMKGVIVHKHQHTGNWTRTKPKFSSALLLPDRGRQSVAAFYIKIIKYPIFVNLSRKKHVIFANSEEKKKSRYFFPT